MLPSSFPFPDRLRLRLRVRVRIRVPVLPSRTWQRWDAGGSPTCVFVCVSPFARRAVLGLGVPRRAAGAGAAPSARGALLVGVVTPF